jgi:hypothetical protein
MFIANTMAEPSTAVRFEFGLAANSLTGQASETLFADGFELQLTAGPTGAGLNETVFSAGGLGVDSSGIEGAIDGGTNVFDVLGGDLESTGESIQFSFDRPGVITGLDFDGVKDESLEFFLLESSGGLRINFVDSRANMPDVPNPLYEHPLDAAISDGVVTGDVVYLWEVPAVFDDEVYGLQIPFSAGQQFTLTFGVVGVPYSQDSGNGARLQAIEVQSVPEPSTLVGALILLAGQLVIKRYRESTGNQTD